MSGGSYNYLYQDDELHELARYSRMEDLRSMADRLAGLGYAADAAAETEELLVILRQSRIRAEVRARRLAAVWKAIEWWDSCDWTEDQVKGALAQFRGEGEEPAP
ncbi:hypothetical protein Ssi03_76330 [Sphaerisporangium siamense]|uniref:Uncharacterized protein n=1 Tax=Sphaerisporangium siamense TaxID=795645 RepID=A0A7W7D2W2_9ACTN|nr:hypothetical protein [Sphaerisporangium siamense]MBB4699314.1 hypothetical protein [Sphaerisporangium siamense]GII89643.1 hypothetical protein Ssi03_76330 [Sphaerisporangium siamense]